MAPTKIETLSHAIGYVGVAKLKKVVDLAGIRSFEFKTKNFDKQTFWDEASVAGHIAEHLALKFNPGDKELSEKAYLTASMANIGKVVGAILFPEKTDKLFAQSQDPSVELPWSVMEKKDGAVDHAVLGEIAGVMWGLPKYALRTIRFHNTPPSRFREEVSGGGFLFGDMTPEEKPKNVYNLHDIVCLSLQYTHWVLFQPDRINEKLFNSFLSVMSIDEKTKDVIGYELSGKFAA